MSDNKAATLRLYDEVFSQGDFDLGDELLTDDFVEHEELPPGIPPGKAAPRALMTMMRGAFPDFKASVEELLEGRHPAQQRLAFEELLAHHLSLRRVRLRAQHLQAEPLGKPGKLLDAFRAGLPFSLTGAQRRVIDELLADLALEAEAATWLGLRLAQALDRALTVIDSTALDDEPRRIQLMMNISVIRARLDDIDAALAMLERAIPEIDRVFGPNHVEAVGARMNLAAFLQFKGDLEGSIAGFEDVLPRAEAALGPDHPQVAAILHNLAGTLIMVERYEEAAGVYPRAIRIRETALGLDHDDTLRSLLGLATTEAGMKDVDRARESFAEIRARLEGKGGSSHPKVAEDLETYADVMAGAGFEREASEARRLAGSVRGTEWKWTKSSRMPRFIIM